LKKKLTSVKFKVPDSAAGPIPIRGINGDLPVSFAQTEVRCRATALSEFFFPGRACDLSDPVARSERIRGQARTVAGRALGRGGRRRGFPCADRGAIRNRPGSLAQIAQVIAEHDGNMTTYA
jgi:hypothetical protein